MTNLAPTPPTSTESPALTPFAADQARLYDHLAGRDTPCPGCGYNLRDLTAPRCPECDRPLRLEVRAAEVTPLWLLLAAAPCAFSLIATILMAVPVAIGVLDGMGPGGMPVRIFLAECFGVVSAVGGLVLATRARAFLRLRTGRQIEIALGVWGLHLLMFVLLILSLWFW